MHLDPFAVQTSLQQQRNDEAKKRLEELEAKVKELEELVAADNLRVINIDISMCFILHVGPLKPQRSQVYPACLNADSQRRSASV